MKRMKKYMGVKNKIFLGIGQFSLVFGISGWLINHYWLNNNPILAFLTGMFLGLSMVLNLAFLIGCKSDLV